MIGRGSMQHGYFSTNGSIGRDIRTRVVLQSLVDIPRVHTGATIMSHWQFMILIAAPWLFIQAHSKLISSSCLHDTAWNSKHVGRKLREWVTSIQVDETYQVGQTYTTFGFFDLKRHRLKFAGLMTDDNRGEGKYWASLGYHEDSNFINGFLYGTPDGTDTITGTACTENCKQFAWGRTLIRFGRSSPLFQDQEIINISDEHAVFLYPDMSTALVGRFNQSVMIAAQTTCVAMERCERGIKRIKVRRPAPNATMLKYFRPDAQSFWEPRVPDRYERRTVFIGQSGNKGDGLFAKRNIKKGELIAYYAGFIYNRTEAPMYFENMTNNEVYAMHTNAISLDQDLSMNIPPEYHSVQRFRATLAHKTNHKFLEPSAYFSRASHPRFGSIRALVAGRFVSRGEEISVNYGYHWDPLSWPSWYLKLYEEEVGLIGDNDVYI